jgi:hypothetical protein
MEIPKELLWAIAIALSIALVAVIQSPYQEARHVPTYQTPGGGLDRDQARDHRTPNLQQQAPQHEQRGNHAGALTILGISPGEWLLGIVAFLLWYAVNTLVRERREASKTQSAVAQSTLRTMQDTACRQLRAYVNVDSVLRVDDPGDVDRVGFAIQVEVRNSGQTPAYDLFQWAKIEVREFPLADRMPIHCVDGGSRAILAPGAKTVTFPAYRHGLSQHEVDAILENQAAIYVYGEIDYRDTFGKRRLTQFRFRCHGQGYAMGTFRADAEGNDAN